MNQIQISASSYTKIPCGELTVDVEGANLKINIGPEEVFICLEDLLADWDCFKPEQKQMLANIVDEIVIKFAEDKDV